MYPQGICVNHTQINLAIHQLDSQQSRSVHSKHRRLFLNYSVNQLPLCFQFSKSLLIFIFQVIGTCQISMYHEFVPESRSFNLKCLQILFDCFFRVSCENIRLSLRDIWQKHSTVGMQTHSFFTHLSRFKNGILRVPLRSLQLEHIMQSQKIVVIFLITITRFPQGGTRLFHILTVHPERIVTKNPVLEFQLTLHIFYLPGKHQCRIQ